MSRSLDLEAPLLGGPLGVRRARLARRSLRWRMAAAPLVAALVVGASAVELTHSPIARPAARPAGEAPGPTAELQPPRGAASDAAVLPPGALDDEASDPVAGVAVPDPAAGPGDQVPPPRPAPEAEDAGGSATRPSDAELLGVAGDAVDAWGRFASNGDLRQVADLYVVDGPQYRQFSAEAGARQVEAGGPPYRFTLRDAVVLGDQPAGDRLVRGTLELTREGQPPQRYRWDLRLRRVADGSWRVWTVLESSA